jgi:hypothetical protein
MVTFPLTSIGHLEAEPGHLHEHHQPQAAASRRSAPSVRDGFEEHWNFVMKKLAPAGYGRSPAWQRDIIERVIIKLTRCALHALVRVTITPALTTCTTSVADSPRLHYRH